MPAEFIVMLADCTLAMLGVVISGGVQICDSMGLLALEPQLFISAHVLIWLAA